MKIGRHLITLNHRRLNDEELGKESEYRRYSKILDEVMQLPYWAVRLYWETHMRTQDSERFFSYA